MNVPLVIAVCVYAAIAVASIELITKAFGHPDNTDEVANIGWMAAFWPVALIMMGMLYLAYIFTEPRELRKKKKRKR